MGCGLVLARKMTRLNDLFAFSIRSVSTTSFDCGESLFYLATQPVLIAYRLYGFGFC